MEVMDIDGCPRYGWGFGNMAYHLIWGDRFRNGGCDTLYQL